VINHHRDALVQEIFNLFVTQVKQFFHPDLASDIVVANHARLDKVAFGDGRCMPLEAIKVVH
jgi:hypothetical protein